MGSTKLHFLSRFRFRRFAPSFSPCSDLFYRLGLSPVAQQVRVASTTSNVREENDAEGNHASRRIIHQNTTEDEDGVRNGSSFDPKMDAFEERSVKYWLQQSSWMRCHPVEKLHLLRHISENAPTLLLYDEANIDAKKERMERGEVKRTEMEGSTSSSVSSPVGALFAASGGEWLSYAARLQICLSLMMWVRGLSDAQDDMARLRLPYSPSTRMMAPTSSSFHRFLPTTTKSVDPALVLRPYPTRKLEYLLDPFTSVALRLHGKLNPIGEQIPSPHTWDPELSLPLEDDDASMGEAGRLECILSKHGRRGPRESAKERLQRVQGLRPRPSRFDNEEEDAVDGNGCEYSGSDSSSSSSSILARLAAGRRNRQARKALACGRRRGSASSRFSNATPAMPAVRFQEAEDTVYHGNSKREEGCPLDREGCATPVSIYVPIEGPFRTHKDEMKATSQSIVISCIKAHAAILSSLFVEGRTVHFRSDHSTVLRYVQEVFHECVDVRALCVSYGSPTILNEEGAVLAARRPYYPTWSTRELLVLLPPKNSSTGSPTFSRADVRSLVGSVLQSIFLHSSPVTVAAPRREGVVEWPSYVLAVKSSVEEQLRFFFPTEPVHGKQARVQWMGLPSPYEDHSGIPPLRRESNHHSGVSTFLEHLSLLSEHFYAVQLLHSPSNCFFSSREVKEVAWHGLSHDTRLVGINVSLWHVLCFFPHVPFLSHKVGNCFRYRAVDRAVITRQAAVPLLTSGVSTRFPFFQKWTEKVFRQRVIPIPSFHAGMPLLPAYAKEQCAAEADDVLHGSLPNSGASEKRTSFASLLTRHHMLSWGKRRRQKKENIPDYCATYFLVCERIIDHLTHPSALSLIALCSARWFGV